MGISCFIVCFNEERHLRRCLESVRWCDEILVIDSGSTDRTLDIAKEYTQKTSFRPWEGYVKQKQAGLELCTQEWILNIDADEEVSKELQTEIQAVISENRPDRAAINGYYINRVVYYLGRWWRHGGWYPEYRLRLARRTATRWGGRDPHEKAMVEGRTAYLLGELYHYTYEDMTDHVARLNAHSSSAAQSLYEAGKKPSLLTILFNPLVRFLKHFFLKGGFHDGMAGFGIAVLEAHYVFLKYMKLWELDRQRKSEGKRI